MMWGDGSWGWWFLMPVIMVAFWAAVIWIIATVIRGPAPPDGGSVGRVPEEILAERYARGDIDDDEYHRRLDTLRRDRAAGKPR